MAEDMGDKTEAPTPRRRQEAREQGQIARSQDLTAAALLLGILLMLKGFGEGILSALRETMVQMIGGTGLAGTDAPGVQQVLLEVFVRNAMALLPLFAGTMLIAIFCNVAQVGFLLSGKRVTPDLKLLNPARGLKKIFGGGQGWVSLGMNFAKMAMIAVVGYSAVHDRIGLIVGAQQLSHLQILSLGMQIVFDVAVRIAVLLLVLAIIDYAYQRHKIEKELRMTKQQVKDDMKNQEGDPQIKRMRRQLQMQRATQRLKADVPRADVIVTNPTHFSIALQYDATAMRAPRVIAKGQDQLAFRIREIAIANGVPILERPPLARALYKNVQVGQEIPEEFYNAVAEILAYVFELSGKMAKAS